MKSKKKIVLAGLVLLVLAMVLLPLAGCKTEVDTSSPQQEQTNDTNENAGTGDNDSTNTEDNTSGGSDSGTGGGDTGDNPSAGNDGENGTVPETPAAKLVSISVTPPPTRTVYSVGQSFDPTSMVVTATYEGGEKREVTGWTTDFDRVAAEKGLAKTVSVSYTEGDTTLTFTYTVDVVNVEEPTKLTTYTSPNNTDGSWTYVAFGEWPQTIKAEGVDVDETKSKTMGMFTCYLGSDGNWYVKEEENANGSGTAYKYSNGEQAGQGGTSTKWFKVEPIVWRVLTTSYKAPEGGTAGNALLLAEKILTGGIKWADSSNNYKESYIRQWLNGNSGTGEISDYNGDAGFLQTAFTQSALGKIAPTTVDNSADRTTDKIFLLSEQEATTESYGFATYSDSGKASPRIRVTTDYAKATGANQSSTGGYGGWWWLRSPYFNTESFARDIDRNGSANDHFSVDIANGGVVPALSISLQ